MEVYANDARSAPPAPLGGRVLLGNSIEHGIEPPEELEPGILLDGLVHILHGPSGSGKTWVLLWLLKRAIERGRRVVYFDAENGPRIISERLQDLGVDPDQVDENLYYFPFPHLTLESATVKGYAALLDTVQPDLVAFDATVNFLGACGLEESSNDDYVSWCVRYTRPARERNIAVVLLDHPGHDGAHARGASRKKDETDVMWAVKCPVPFDRETTSTVTLRREKDREGWLPKSIAFNIGGTDDGGHIILARTDHAVVDAQGDDGLRQTERITLEALREEFGAAGASYSDWQRASERREISKSSFKRARSTLVERLGFVRLDGETYYPVENPPPPEDGGPTKKRIDKPDTQRVHEGPDRVHGPCEPLTNGRGSIGSTTLKGGPNGPNVGPNGLGSRFSEDKRHVGGSPESAQKAAREGEGDGALHPDNPSLLAETASEQGDSENDACRDDSLVKSEAEVFEVARAYFGLEPMRERAGAA